MVAGLGGSAGQMGKCRFPKDPGEAPAVELDTIGPDIGPTVLSTSTGQSQSVRGGQSGQYDNPVVREVAKYFPAEVMPEVAALIEDLDLEIVAIHPPQP